MFMGSCLFIWLLYWASLFRMLFENIWALHCYIKEFDKQTYEKTVKKIVKKLLGWNASSLFLAGRATITQAILQAIPLYVMQTLKILMLICDKMKSHCRVFIWGSNREDQKIYLIDLNSVCMPWDKRGLSLKDLRTMNRVLMLKLALGLVTNKDSLWVCDAFQV